MHWHRDLQQPVSVSVSVSYCFGMAYVWALIYQIFWQKAIVLNHNRSIQINGKKIKNIFCEAAPVIVQMTCQI